MLMRRRGLCKAWRFDTTQFDSSRTVGLVNRIPQLSSLSMGLNSAHGKPCRSQSHGRSKLRLALGRPEPDARLGPKCLAGLEVAARSHLTLFPRNFPILLRLMYRTSVDVEGREIRAGPAVRSSPIQKEPHLISRFCVRLSFRSTFFRSEVWVPYENALHLEFDLPALGLPTPPLRARS